MKCFSNRVTMLVYLIAVNRKDLSWKTCVTDWWLSFIDQFVFSHLQNHASKPENLFLNSCRWNLCPAGLAGYYQNFYMCYCFASVLDFKCQAQLSSEGLLFEGKCKWERLWKSVSFKLLISNEWFFIFIFFNTCYILIWLRTK